MPLFDKRINETGGWRAIRSAIVLPTSVLTLERSCCATIENVTETDARLRGGPDVSVGDDLWIKVGCLDRLVTVVWSGDAEFQVAFDAPLDHEDLIHLRCEARNTLVMRLEPGERTAAQEWIEGLLR